MSSLRPVGRSAAAHKNDRKSLCHFTFADGRQCRTPRCPGHPHLCSDHARKDSQARAANELADDLSYFFSGEYLSACDLSAALGRLIAGVARGDIKPRTARTLAYLSQTLFQTIRLAQHEYINARGTDGWRSSVRHSINHNVDYLNPSPSSEIPTLSGPASPPDQPPPVEAGLQSGDVQAPHVVAGFQPGQAQAPQPSSASQPAGPPSNRHSEPARRGGQGEESAFPESRPARSQTAPTPQQALSPHTPIALTPPSVSAPHVPLAPTSAQFAQPPTPATQRDNPSTVSPTPKTVLPLDSRAYHFDTSYRLLIDGKPF